jgi:poly(beta-D-mannuronate) lyase
MSRSERLCAAVLLCSCFTFLTACGGADVATSPLGSVPAAAGGTADLAEPTGADDAAADGTVEDVGDDELLDPAAPDTELKALGAPSRNFDLTHWYLTLPSADAVSTVELNSGYQYGGVFYTDARSGGMVFNCPNLAGHTPNSTHSRTELREVLNPDNSSMTDPSNNWTTADGGQMIAALRIDHASTTGTTNVGNVVIGQIHGPSTEVVRLHYVKLPNESSGRLYAATEDLSGHGVHSPDLVSNASGDGIRLGERFTYQIRLVGRTLTVYIGRANHPTVKYTKTIDAGYVGLNLYFKAGVYNQDNTGSTSDYVQATFFKLTHTHP